MDDSLRRVESVGMRKNACKNEGKTQDPINETSLRTVKNIKILPFLYLQTIEIFFLHKA